MLGMRGLTSTRQRLTALSLVSVGAGALVAAGPGGAQSQTKPEPACAGVAIVDPEGDKTQGGDSSDVTAGFFVTRNGGTTYNIRVKNLSTNVPQGFTAVTWYGLWKNAAGATKFVSADVDFSGATSFNYGTFGTSFQEEGTSVGKLHMGPGGVIEITIPSEIMEDKLSGPYVDSRLARSVPGVGGIVSQADRAPDQGAGTDYMKQDCGAATQPTPTATPTATPAPSETAVPAPSPTPSPTPTPTPTPAPGGGGGSNGTPPGSGGPGTAPSQPATLPVKLVKKRVKGKGRRRVVFKLRAGERVTRLAARLRSGNKTVAVGRLKKVGKRSTLKLRGSRKLRKGRYVLDLTGVNARGERGSVSFRVRLR